jgi:hypothetical protein
MDVAKGSKSEREKRTPEICRGFLARIQMSVRKIPEAREKPTQKIKINSA